MRSGNFFLVVQVLKGSRPSWSVIDCGNRFAAGNQGEALFASSPFAITLFWSELALFSDRFKGLNPILNDVDDRLPSFLEDSVLIAEGRRPVVDAADRPITC